MGRTRWSLSCACLGRRSYLRCHVELGRNPSVGGCRRRLETHLFGFDGDLYGRTLRVELLEKIRDERTFPSVESLGRQLAEDRATILQRIGSESVSK